MKNQMSINGMPVNSPLGRRLPDSSGSPVGVVRLDPEKAYSGTAELLKEVIDQSSQEAWEKIKAKIDYIYAGLDSAQAPLNEETGFGKEIKNRLNKGQKLLFKPNLVSTSNIDPQTARSWPGQQ